MNAYELADELKACIDDGSTDLVCVEQAAHMLRKQADQIAELEKQSWTEKDLKNACRNARLSENDFLRIKSYLPVYTTPQTKPLSDEEIETIYLKTLNKFEFARAIEAKVRGEK